MNRANKIIAVTLVTAFIFIVACFPVSATTEYGIYGQGGFSPPISSSILSEEVCIFIPFQVGSDGVYTGRYYQFPSACKVRLIIYPSSDGYYFYAFQVNSSGLTSFTYYRNEGQYPVKWRSSVSSWTGNTVSCTWSDEVGAYGTVIGLGSVSTKYIDDDGVYHSYVVDSEGYDSSWYSGNSLFDWWPQSDTTYYIPTPLVSDADDWAFNYGYETPEQEQEAIEQSRYDEQNRIMREGFTAVIDSINSNAANIQQAITNVAGEIINAGSDMPTLDTNNDWMNDSLTKVNEWLSQMQAFEEQMKKAEEENSENMAQASNVINGFFDIMPKPIIAVVIMAAVMIVVVKGIGR